MFDTVARRYDRTNDVLSMGQDRRWRKRVVRLVDPKRGELILDLAAGTGTSSVPFAAAGATVIPCDFSIGMLEVGRETLPGLPFVAGDGMGLPFADGTFDAVTISFGLRNIHETATGLRELLRVTKPGGTMVFETTVDPRPDALVRLRWPENGKAKGVPTMQAVRLELAWTGWRRVRRFTGYRPGTSEALLLCEKTDELRTGDDLSDVVTPHRPDPDMPA